MNNKNLNGGFVGILMLLVVVSGMIFFMVRTDLFTGQKTGKSMLEQNQDAMDRANALKIQIEQNGVYPTEE